MYSDYPLEEQNKREKSCNYLLRCQKEFVWNSTLIHINVLSEIEIDKCICSMIYFGLLYLLLLPLLSCIDLDKLIKWDIYIKSLNICDCLESRTSKSSYLLRHKHFYSLNIRTSLDLGQQFIGISTLSYTLITSLQHVLK